MKNFLSTALLATAATACASSPLSDPKPEPVPLYAGPWAGAGVDINAVSEPNPSLWATSPNALLSMRIPVGVGILSYHLYLWHWPAIVLWKWCVTTFLHTDPDASPGSAHPFQPSTQLLSSEQQLEIGVYDDEGPAKQACCLFPCFLICFFVWMLWLCDWEEADFLGAFEFDASTLKVGQMSPSEPPSPDCPPRHVAPFSGP